ncbi:MAG TPA: rhodanese-like domain-containing protein [Candidatus Lumbricidophila sp.]|nr:rhodanese-like domain-containing protein [Candidatus Lumbricidophila sp.]
MSTIPAIFETVANSEQALAFFRGRLSVETDASDVLAGLVAPEPGFVVVDVRGDAAWAQGHVPGAIHLPYREIATRAAELIPAGTPVVVYCWSPGCNAGVKGGIEFAKLGYPVKEMIGGFEYWVREGFRFDTELGSHVEPADPRVNVVAGAWVSGALTRDEVAAAAGASCGC